MDADDIINAYEANKREIEELREEKKQIEALQNRLIEIDEQWDKELKKLAKTNNQLQRLGKAWQKTHHQQLP